MLTAMWQKHVFSRWEKAKQRKGLTGDRGEGETETHREIEKGVSAVENHCPRHSRIACLSLLSFSVNS